MRVLGVLSLAAALSCVGHANVMFDNTGAVPNGSDPIQAVSDPQFSGPLFDSFFTGSSAGSLTGLGVVMTGHTSPGSVQFDLFADSSTAPGLHIATLGTLNDSSLVGPPTLYNINLSATPLLAANTRYWVVASGTTSASWDWSSDISGPGVANEFFGNYAGGVPNVFPNSDGPYMMRVSVPEPSALIPMAGLISFFGLGVLRRKKAKI